MDHLEELKMSVKFKDQDELVNYSSPVYFPIPQHLTSLDIEFHFWPECHLRSEVGARAYLSSCLKQIALQSKRLNRLYVMLESCEGAMDCPRELQIMTTLTDITLRKCNLDQQIDVIKLMPLVRLWRLPRWPTAAIQRLVEGSGPPPLLEDLGTFVTVDESMAEQLKRVGSLTKLPIFMSCNDPTKFLPHFPRLSILSLYCQDSVDGDLLSTALSTCVSLTDLSLLHSKLTSLNVAEFLPHLSSLVNLQFHCCSGLVSLGFLTTASASLRNLRTFSISHSDQMPITEYHHHLPIISSSLESLTIFNSSVPPLDVLTISRWTPGSLEFHREEWPRLQAFSRSGHDWSAFQAQL